MSVQMVILLVVGHTFSHMSRPTNVRELGVLKMLRSGKRRSAAISIVRPPVKRPLS